MSVSKPSSQLHHLRRRLQGPVAALLLAFVLMQWVGLMHGMVHAGQGGEHSIAFKADSWLGKLAASHEDGSSVCQDLDHLTHGNAPLLAVAELPAPTPILEKTALPPLPQARVVAALYRARAPPVFLA